MMNPLVAGFFSLLPVLSVPLMLMLFRNESVWPAIIVYHALCWSVPLLSGATLKSAGFVSGQLQAWFRRSLILSMALLVGGEIAHYLVVTGRMTPWWDPIHSLAQNWTLYVIYSLALNPITEEFYWRGFLLSKMSLLRNAWLFWLMHAAALIVYLPPAQAVGYTAPTLLFGLVCAWIRREYGTLWPCILLHLAADAATLRAAG